MLVCLLLESHCGSACSTASTSCIAFVLTILITDFISASAFVSVSISLSVAIAFTASVSLSHTRLLS